MSEQTIINTIDQLLNDIKESQLDDADWLLLDAVIGMHYSMVADGRLGVTDRRETLHALRELKQKLEVWHDPST